MLDHPNPDHVPEALDAVRFALRTEANAVEALWKKNAESLEKVLNLLAHRQGRVVISGLGKSGLIGAKLAATWNSFGIPTLFLNSSEALHGDFGMCTPKDMGIVISYSGTTTEVVAVAQWMKTFGMPVVAMSHSAETPLGQLADIHLSIEVHREADPLNLGPTSSTTATLALGDALASGMQVLCEFTPEDFHLRHPGGALGSALGTIDA